LKVKILKNFIYIFLLLSLCTNSVISAAAEIHHSFDTDSPKNCVAVRGNGGRGAAHMSALANSHERYGMLWGIAGASSGSVLSFLVDSIYGNPLLKDCEGTQCSPTETAARAALLMKSELSRTASLAQFPEATTFTMFFRIAMLLKEQDIEHLLIKDPPEGMFRLRQLLLLPALSDIINPEILRTIEQSSEPVAVAKDIVKGLLLGANFEFDGLNTFIRPGIVSFPKLTEFLGRMGDFLSLQGDFVDRQGMATYLKTCAVPGLHRPWSQVREMPAGNTTCGRMYTSLIQDYYQKARNSGQPSVRLNQVVGTNLRTLVSIARLEGPSALKWEQAQQSYLSGATWHGKLPLRDLTIGYFGNDSDLDKLQANKFQYDDIKTSKIRILKGQTWRDVLNTSPAEPGISSGVKLATKELAVGLGGWIDLHPVQSLLNIGCDVVVLQTTEGPMLNQYSDKVLDLFDATPSEHLSFYSLDQTNSSLAQALKKVSGIKCIDYDKYSILDVDGLADAGWNAPFLTQLDFFKTGPNPDPKIVHALNKKGCSP
jgi:hypothetical protein